MKLLILFSFFTLSFAQANEISDQALEQKFVSVLKEKEITQGIGSTQEVQECRDKFIKKGTSNPTGQELDAALDCFKTKVLNKYKSDPKALNALSESLELEKYGLVKSKNSTEITAYLSDRLYHSLTGINPAEKNQQKIIEQLKFKNRKMVDQKLFFEIYQTQLQKSALFEVSRFCFENLRLAGNTSNDFATHWKDLFDVGDAKKFLAANAAKITDEESKPFGLSGVNFTDQDQDKLQEEIFKSMGDLKDENKVKAMGQFFVVCLSSMNNLCEFHEQNPSPATTSSTKMPKGGNACLARGRLEKMRKTLAATETIIKEHYGKLTDSGGGFQLNNNQVTFFDPSKTTVDDLTATTSKDILDTYNDDSMKIAEKCSQPANASLPECAKFVDVGDDLNQAKNNMDLDFAFKKETEMAKISALKQDETKLEEYLKDNGYISLLAKWQEDKTQVNIEEEVGKIIEAKRVATITDIQSRLGKRQLSESDVKNTPGKKETSIQENAQGVMEEKARLAQVVLFSNIITSQLVITQDKKEIGRNVSGIKKEMDSLGSGVNKDNFEGLQGTIDANKGSKTGGFSEGLKILDLLLGGSSPKED